MEIHGAQAGKQYILRDTLLFNSATSTHVALGNKLQTKKGKEATVLDWGPNKHGSGWVKVLTKGGVHNVHAAYLGLKVQPASLPRQPSGVGLDVKSSLPVGFVFLGKQACGKCDALASSQLFDTKEEAFETRARWSTAHAQYRTARIAAVYELNDPAA